MKTHQVLALAPSKIHNAEITKSLAPIACVMHEGYSGQDIGRIIRENEIDAVIFAGELPGLSAERILTAVAERVPHATLIISLKDTGIANMLAARFKGHALPWPMRSDTVKTLLAGVTRQTFILPRREIRWRMLSGAAVEKDGAFFPSLLLNVSHSGLMVLSDADVALGQVVKVHVPHAGVDYGFSGRVCHLGSLETVNAALHEAPWLHLQRPSSFGLELTPASKVAAMELCKQIRQERALLNLRVTCVPQLPKSLTQTFLQFGIKVETAPALPAADDALPPIILVDVSVCSTSELMLLEELRKRSVIIGIASMPITDKVRESHASALPGVFSMPHQVDQLVRHVEDFFAPIDRRFPRIEQAFSATFQSQSGEKIVAQGVNLSLHGCGIELTEALEPGAKIRGTLAMDEAIDAYTFRGEVVYCVPVGDHYRAGVTFRIHPPADISYQKFLSVRFLKQLRTRWEHQLNGAHAGV